ncbi:MAG: CmcI family methyltransferase [Acetobacteraceae bacterium]
MDISTTAGFEDVAASFEPWLQRRPADIEQQKAVHAVLREKAGAVIGAGCYVSPEARVMTDRLHLGNRSWIAAGAIVRGSVHLGSDCSVNPYAHIAGRVRIGNFCRIASLASIYGFNHGTDQIDVPIGAQQVTSKGIVLGDDVWVGANVVIVDGVEIGSHCVIAGGAVVTKSFPPYQIIGGNPARVIRDRRPPAPATVTGEVRGLLFSEDPYADYAPTLPRDLQGWDSENSVFKSIISEVKPKLIVEVGTWKGASAIHMAKLCRQLGLSTEIVCVDTWLGNWQHWARKDGVGSRVDLRLKNGFPGLYHQFLSNVVHENMQDIITPLPLTGIAGARLFAAYKLKPQVIYIDGDHEYESAISDLRGWLPQLADGGVLIGDDYKFPGVERAAQEIAAEGQWLLDVLDNKFLIRRAPR